MYVYLGEGQERRASVTIIPIVVFWIRGLDLWCFCTFLDESALLQCFHPRLFSGIILALQCCQVLTPPFTKTLPCHRALRMWWHGVGAALADPPLVHGLPLYSQPGRTRLHTFMRRIPELSFTTNLIVELTLVCISKISRLPKLLLLLIAGIFYVLIPNHWIKCGWSCTISYFQTYAMLCEVIKPQHVTGKTKPFILMPLLKLLESDKDVQGHNEEELGVSGGSIPLLEPSSDSE